MTIPSLYPLFLKTQESGGASEVTLGLSYQANINTTLTANIVQNREAVAFSNINAEIGGKKEANINQKLEAKICQ